MKIGNIYKWRHKILEKDNYQCQECGLPHRNYFSIPFKLRPVFEAHHIIKVKDDPSRIFDIENGMTLCICCHRSEHRTQEVKE